MKITSESLAFWFLRLNGFLTIPNFVVHPEGPRVDGAYPQQTDVDVLGVRFPFRAENRERPMHDHQVFVSEPRTMVVLSEVKTNRCALNGPWTNPMFQNLQKVLCAGGFRPVGEVQAIADALYKAGLRADDALVIRIICFGARASRALRKGFPAVPQLLWAQDVLPFIYRRFIDYRLEKQMHHQWGHDADELFRTANEAPKEDIGAFVNAVEVISA